MNVATKKLSLRALAISFTVAALVMLGYGAGLLERLEWQSYDWRVAHYRAEKTADPRIAVVLIDDASLKAMNDVAGRWPWPRSVYADLLEYFGYAAPQSVSFDITFTEKQGFGFKGEGLLNPHDQRLVDATAEAPYAHHAARLVLDSADEVNTGLLNRPLPRAFVDKFSVTARLGGAGVMRGFNDPRNNAYYLPMKELYEATRAVGSVEVNADADGVYRHARLFHRYQDDYFPALSTSALLQLLKPTTIERTEGTIRFGDVDIPVAPDGAYLVNYYGRYTTYSFSGLMASLQQIRAGDIEHLVVDPAEFQDKIVFIGASAAGLEDLKKTPVHSKLPGVLIHAAIVSNVLNSDFLQPAAAAMTYTQIALLAPLTCLGVFLLRRNTLKMLLPLAVAAAFLAWAHVEFQRQVLVDVVPPLASVALAWAASFASLLFTEGREKRKFKRMMSQYLSPAVLATVIDNPEDYAKAEVGSKENLSILFSDIRSFTSLSERLPAEQVVEMLNYYFSAMTDTIFKHQGTIDKFIGDAIMAFWGAPLRIADHADKAVASALEMIQRLAQVNAWLESNGFPRIEIGIGIHSGDVILGNIGSESKLEYTVIGDNVNLASRLEGLTKTYDCPLLITETTHAGLTLPIPCRLVDLVRVKGKQVPIRIYHPMALPATLPPDQHAALEDVARRTTQAFMYYLERRWDQAIETLEGVPHDRVSEQLLERCRDYQTRPPSADWDGAHTMTTK